MTTPVRVVTYSRFSTDRQTDSSITDQERVCAEYAARQGWEICERFCDQGISGAAIGNRPGFLRMREAAMARPREFDVLLIMDISRLSRSLGDVAKLADQFVFAGVRIIAIHDNADTDREGWEMQFGFAGLIGQHFRKMVKLKTYAALETRAKTQRPTGGRAYGYRSGQVNESEAQVVREIFDLFIQGTSTRKIAVELNSRSVLSPGSSWERVTRRCSGWTGSAIRSMLLNARYTGSVIWNRCQWNKDPDTGRRVRRTRPRSEWILHQDETQRIVTDEQWQQAQKRTRSLTNPDVRLKSGGKAKYLLSGLLKCERCGGNFILGSAASYCCGGHLEGHCTNSERIRKDELEREIITPLNDGLLSPERVRRMAKELGAGYAAAIQSVQTRAEEAPKELKALEARIERLRSRLRAGDPDLPTDELQAAIERAEVKRSEMMAVQPQTRHSAKVVSMLPRAAAEYSKQIKMGLDGDPRAALKARLILRDLVGPVRLSTDENGAVWASYKLNPAALIRAAGGAFPTSGTQRGTDGSGGSRAEILIVRVA